MASAQVEATREGVAKLLQCFLKLQQRKAISMHTTDPAAT
jgi:hypothetical protein